MSATPIAQQVTELRGQAEPAAPPNAYLLEQAALRVDGLPPGVLATGSVLPDAPLLDAAGRATGLYAAVGQRPAVLVLYRGAWCPYCNIALRAYQASLAAELAVRDVALVAVSPQRPDGSLTTAQKDGLTFAVLSDPGNTVGRALGVLTTPSADALRAQLSSGLDLTAVNADGTPELPMPTAVVLNADRTVEWIDVHPDYTTRSEPADILAAVDAAAGRVRA